MRHRYLETLNKTIVKYLPQYHIGALYCTIKNKIQCGIRFEAILGQQGALIVPIERNEVHDLGNYYTAVKIVPPLLFQN